MVDAADLKSVGPQDCAGSSPARGRLYIFNRAMPGVPGSALRTSLSLTLAMLVKGSEQSGSGRLFIFNPIQNRPFSHLKHVTLSANTPKRSILGNPFGQGG